MELIPFYEDFLSFKREPGKRQILSVTLFYADGSQDELNVSSPHIRFSEGIERQYIHIRRYLNESAADLGLVGYHAKMLFTDGEEIIQGPQWARVDIETPNQSVQ